MKSALGNGRASACISIGSPLMTTCFTSSSVTWREPMRCFACVVMKYRFPETAFCNAAMSILAMLRFVQRNTQQGSQHSCHDHVGIRPVCCAPFVLLSQDCFRHVRKIRAFRYAEQHARTRSLFGLRSAADFPSWTSRVRSPSPALNFQEL